MRCHDFVLWTILLFQFTYTVAYNIRNHPCCQEPSENLTLAMIIDAFEIYGHDPTEKLDHLLHYQLKMMKVKRAPDQYLINELVHIATDYLARFIRMHIKELKVLLVALDDAIDNMLTMYEIHNTLKAERIASYTSLAGGAVPSEFYISQEFYCGKNVYIFLSEIYSDIYNMGRGLTPYCSGRGFHFLGFIHFMDEKKYVLEDDPGITFSMDNYVHGLECHRGICIYRFPFKKHLQHTRDVITLPKAIVKCGTDMYKLPPLTAASCIITSGSFILDFNIQGMRYRHYDYLLMIPNGKTYYTKEAKTPLTCDHHVCEWNYTNHFGGPFVPPGDPPDEVVIPPPPLIEQTTENAATAPPVDTGGNGNDTSYFMEGCWYMYPPQYGSIAGISYLDSLSVNEWRFTCQGASNGLYWYPQWMGAPPNHPYGHSKDTGQYVDDMSEIYFPHMSGVNKDIRNTGMGPSGN